MFNYIRFTQYLQIHIYMILSLLEIRFPPESPLKPVPKRPRQTDSLALPRLPRWDDYEEVLPQGNVPLKPLVLVRKRPWIRFPISLRGL